MERRFQCFTQEGGGIAWVQLEAVALSGVSSLVSSLRPKTTPTPTGSFSVNGMPMEVVDYERLKQVDLTQHHSHPQPTEAHTSHQRLPQPHRCSVAVTSTVTERRSDLWTMTPALRSVHVSTQD